MKPIVALLLCSLGVCVLAHAGETRLKKNDVPQAVLKAFAHAYPRATIVGYARETENGSTYYELESRDGTVRRDLLYTPEGAVAEIEETVAMSDLPDAVAMAFSAESPKSRPTRVEKTTRGETITYAFGMGKGRTELIIAADGAVVEHSKEVQPGKKGH